LSFFDELRRRNVFRIAGLYLVAAWLAVQVAGTVLPMFDAPAWLPRTIVMLLAIGFLPALIFAWVFELTPEGLKREKEVERTASIAPRTGRALDRIIMVALALAVGYFAFDKFVLAPQRAAAFQQLESQKLAAARREGRIEAMSRSYGDKSIAVLPFVNMSADKEQEYFSDGISEELLNQLAKIRELRVIARTSSFSFKGRNIEIAEIARRLNVAHVLEGSVRRSGKKLRITAQLIRAADSSHLWSETYDRELDDIFAVQDEIAGAVVEQLKVELLGGAPKARATDPKAFALVLQGRELAHQFTAAGSEQAIALYRQALAIDPAYAAAWVGLTSAYINQAVDGLRPIDESYRRAREAVNRALALDPDDAQAHARLSRIALDYDGDLAGAAQHMARALELAPEDAGILRNAATLARSLGRLDDAIAIGEVVTVRDPVGTSSHANLGLGYRYAGSLDAAIASLRTALALSPGYLGAHYNIGVALLLKGRPEAALAEMQQESDAGPWRQIGLPMVWHSLGRKAESDAALAELIRTHEKDSAFNIAYVLAYRGEADRAFEWLEKAVAYHDTGLADIVVEPLFANIRKDPRWLPFLHRIGRDPGQLAAIRFDVKPPQ
jgi:TolB-like protein/lipoprotein NlpI